MRLHRTGATLTAIVAMITMADNVQAQTARPVGVVAAQQGEKTMTLEDLNFGGHNYRNMVAQNRPCTWWGDELIRQDAQANYLVDKKTGHETRLFAINEINQWAGPTKDRKVGSLRGTSFPYAGKSIVVVSGGDKIYTIDFKKHALVSVRQWDEGDELLESCPASEAVAYLKGGNLYVSRGLKQWQLSHNGSRQIVYGQSVHRDEFGIRKGTFWSPDGMRLAFYRMDQSMVTDYPQVNIPEIGFNHPETQSCIATAAPDKYPMAGETSHKVTVGVFDLSTGKTVYLKAGDPTDRYFTNIAWSPDGASIYMFELNRDQNDCRLTCYDATTGEKKGELYRETDAKYVEPQHPILFLPWDSSQFIMQSRKDGYNHLYLCTIGKHGSRMGSNTESVDIRQLTKGQWEVMEVLGFNRKRKSVVIASNECSPIQRNLFVVDCRTGKRALTEDGGNGWHYGTLSQSGRYIYDNYSAPSTPRKIAIVDTENGHRTPYFTAPNPWKGYQVPEYSCGSIKADDGQTDLYYRMVKPIGFDPS